jgi:hypothetical protein
MPLVDELRQLVATSRATKAMRFQFESAWVQRIREEDEECTDFMTRLPVRVQRADTLADVLRHAASLGLEELVIIDGWDEYRTFTINATYEDMNTADQPVWAAAEAAGLKLEACILHLGNQPPTAKLTVKASWK